MSQHGVTLVHLDDADRSLTSLKAKVMLGVETPFVTWADSDAFFTGDVSGMLPPSSPLAPWPRFSARCSSRCAKGAALADGRCIRTPLDERKDNMVKFPPTN